MRMGAVALGFAFAALLAGCTDSPPETHTPRMTFDNMQPVQLDVASIEVRDVYKPPMQSPNVEHNFQTPPYVAAENLLHKQLAAAGNRNVLRVSIIDASVVQEELPAPEGGILNALKREPAERLKAKVLLRFELYDPAAPDIIIGHADIIAKRTKTLLEGTTLAERERAYFTLTEDLMDDLNDGLRSSVQNTFGKKPG